MKNNNNQLLQNLFKITTTHREYFNHPLIIVPDKIECFPWHFLFSEDNSYKVLELGAGSGEFCLKWLEQNPEHEYIAFEVKSNRIKKFLNNATIADKQNLKIIPVNFKWFLESLLPKNCFNLIIINFPDPWPKKRHWKHRLVDREFPNRMKKILQFEGEIYIATDYGPYARKIFNFFLHNPAYKPIYRRPFFLRNRPANFPTSRFEQIHLKEGRIPYYQAWTLAI